MDKTLLKPTWTYGIQLWASAKSPNLNRIQAFQGKCLRKISKAPLYTMSPHAHSSEISLTLLSKKFLKLPIEDSTPAYETIQTVSLPTNIFFPCTVPDDPGRRLKQKWYHELLVE